MSILHITDNLFHSNSDLISVSGNEKVYYISQDNYYIADLENNRNITYYCDSATSCIIIIVYNKDKNQAAISHLSRPGRFKMFFDIVEQLFGGDKNVYVYASGANPPSDETAKRNANQVLGWISSLKNKGWETNVSFEKGDPSKPENNLDCYGLHCDENGNVVVNNNRICLTIDQRDPTGGLQTLFCIFGDPNIIRYQTSIFSKSDIKEWVEKGYERGFDKAVDMTDDEILKNFSSTPEYEVPWFCDTIRQAGKYVKDHINEGRTLECVQ